MSGKPNRQSLLNSLHRLGQVDHDHMDLNSQGGREGATEADFGNSGVEVDVQDDGGGTNEGVDTE